MSDKDKIATLILITIAMVLIPFMFMFNNDISVLNPKGLIAVKEYKLIIIATLLMLIVVIPVYILTFTIAWKYREGNKSARYKPDWDHHTGLETAWWAIPGVIIIILSFITWQSSHELDPVKNINTDNAASAVDIEVVALQWKWLFIYPKQNIATVNFVQFPEDTPLNFKITADAPMNSFWIPDLGGQIYAMSGMATQLHLIADEQGDFRGSSANISGEGFAGMNFTARASSAMEFEGWVQKIKQTPHHLSMYEYSRLAQPSQDTPDSYYSTLQTGLFNEVVHKYSPYSSHGTHGGGG